MLIPARLILNVIRQHCQLEDDGWTLRCVDEDNNIMVDYASDSSVDNIMIKMVIIIRRGYE